jgi:hypothetical protein
MIEYECWSCSASFGMTDETRKRLVANGTAFFCINGCRLTFGKGRVHALEEQLAEEKERTRRESARAQVAMRAAQRFKCPHCVRSYATRQGLLKHDREVHKAPLRLAKNAGPDALNSKVS